MVAPFPASHLNAQGLIPAAVLDDLGRAYQIFPWTGFGTLYGTRATVRAAQAEIRTHLRGVVSRLLFVTPARAKILARLARWPPGASGQRLAAMLASSME